MKKITMAVLLCVGMLVPALAQEAQQDSNPFVNKRGIALLPKAGDYAIGVEVDPFLNYLGNMFNGNLNNQSPAFVGRDITLFGKYFLEDNRAVRVRLGLNFTGTQFKQTVRDDFSVLSDPTNSDATTVDILKHAQRGVNIGIGYEFRRGKGRVQGFYGGEVAFSYARDRYNFTYGNPITDANRTPSTADFTSQVGFGNLSPLNQQGYRMTERRDGASFGMGIGGFAGVEYFFAPQISIGGELGLSVSYEIKGQDEITAEGFLGSEVKTFQSRERSMYDTAFETSIKTIPQGRIFLMFHF